MGPLDSAGRLRMFFVVALDEVVVANSAEGSKYTINKDSSRKKIILDFGESIAQSISFNLSSSPCVLEGDPRDLFFELKNIQLTEI
jgi:hypothetical protein